MSPMAMAIKASKNLQKTEERKRKGKKKKKEKVMLLLFKIVIFD
jgi:hypothetical protein